MDKEQIKKQIARAIEKDPLSKENIKKASLFGSYLHETAKENSDVDILVEFKPAIPVGLFEFVQIQRNLGELISKKIDLLTPESLSKFFKDKVLNEAEIIYEG